jgi:hypothetical protein
MLYLQKIIRNYLFTSRLGKRFFKGNMKIYTDYLGNQIRLTDERLEHILIHPEMADMIGNIEDTLLNPEYVIQSIQDETVSLYNKYYITERFGGKFLCIIVKENKNENDNFIVTSYLMNKLPKGRVLWQRN